MKSKPLVDPKSSIFPPSWDWLMDEGIPNWVKSRYSPQERWKDKPFGEPDARFFYRGIEELSELFTEERPRSMPTYFQHPKFRSAYLLYFLPLQAAKFLSLFHAHAHAMNAALDHGRKTGTLRILDLGAGPGTASIAFLLWVLGLPSEQAQDLPPIELEWVDTNRTILEDGKSLVELLVSHFPRLRSRVSVRFHVAPWWKAPSLSSGETSLIFMGHVLNEAAISTSRRLASPDSQTVAPALGPLAKLAEKMSGGGILLVEPAARRSSQHLSQLRDQLLSTKAISPEPTSIWGPCLHAQACPLASGRDWCHFSIPIRIPGKWFKKYSEGLGSERQWVKFSYNWFASKKVLSKAAAPFERRVISDPMKKEGSPKSMVLLCEPEQPGRWLISQVTRLHRGDIVDVRESDPRDVRGTPRSHVKGPRIKGPRVKGRA